MKQFFAGLLAAPLMASACFAAGSPDAGMPRGDQMAAVSNQDVSLKLANALAQVALGACADIGKVAVVAVVDRGGNLVALQRGDKVGPHNTQAAIKKAFTALSTKTDTKTLDQNARTNPSAANLTTIDALLLLGGGVPLRAGDEVVGAIGVAGAGGADNDHACAQKAADALRN